MNNLDSTLTFSQGLINLLATIIPHSVSIKPHENTLLEWPSVETYSMFILLNLVSLEYRLMIP